MALPYQWQWRIDKWKNAVRGLFGGGNQQPRPKICPACGSLVGISATKCHQCGTNLTFSLAAVSKGLSKFFGGRAPVTTVILIANLIMFAISWMATAASGQGGGLSILWGLGGEALYRLGESYPPAIFFGHEWFRLVTAMFLHGGLIHIGFNMMVLMDIGPVVEEVYGSAKFLFLYVATGVVGFLFSAFFGGHPSVGASAPILGLIGLLIAMTTKRGGAHMQDLRSRLISWVVSIFVFGFIMRGVDNWAHGGGLAAGFVLGKLFADREPLNATERRTANLLGLLAVLALIASFALMILHYRDLGQNS
ncbi:MAG TPA: rhomboid family intramembrane serine protease [Candidatus Eisenbacteria bacterium]|nr:rhomboid family intramembrane serine protease [Candidatus Eisenbacteria bacterium]